MKRISFFCLLAMAIAFCSCDKDDDSEDELALSGENGIDSSPSVMQIDMTVMVPVEPSSMEYFYYVVRYSDNNGLVQVDTISKNKGGIAVEDWQDGGSYEVTLLAPSNSSNNSPNCYAKTYSYTSLPVSSCVTVELIPKCPKDNVASFSFITPKPYIYPNVYSSESSVPEDDLNQTLDGINVIMIDSMTIDRFLSIYGDTFTSVCQVKVCDGYDVIFY